MPEKTYINVPNPSTGQIEPREVKNIFHRQPDPEVTNSLFWRSVHRMWKKVNGSWRTVFLNNRPPEVRFLSPSDGSDALRGEEKSFSFEVYDFEESLVSIALYIYNDAGTLVSTGEAIDVSAPTSERSHATLPGTWKEYQTTFTFPQPGAYRVEARAEDAAELVGVAQVQVNSLTNSSPVIEGRATWTYPEDLWDRETSDEIYEVIDGETLPDVTVRLDSVAIKAQFGAEITYTQTLEDGSENVYTRSFPSDLADPADSELSVVLPDTFAGTAEDTEVLVRVFATDKIDAFVGQDNRYGISILADDGVNPATLKEITLDISPAAEPPDLTVTAPSGSPGGVRDVPEGDYVTVEFAYSDPEVSGIVEEAILMVDNQPTDTRAILGANSGSGAFAWQADRSAPNPRRLGVKVRDDQGKEVFRNAPDDISVYERPRISWVLPVDRGRVVSHRNFGIQVDVDAETSISSVELRINGDDYQPMVVSNDPDLNQRYVFDWFPTSVGQNRLRVRATTGEGYTRTSEIYVTVIDGNPPAINVISHAEGETLTQEEMLNRVISASVVDNIAVSEVEIYLDGNLIRNIQGGAGDSYSASLALEDFGITNETGAATSDDIATGAYMVEVVAYDDEENYGEAEVNVNVVANPDTSPPVISSLDVYTTGDVPVDPQSPGVWRVGDQLKLVVAATDSDSAIDRVEALLSGAAVSSDAEANVDGEYEITVQFSSTGSTSVAARAVDAEGNTRTATWGTIDVLTADTVDPSITWGGAPSELALGEEGVFIAGATDNLSGVNRIEFTFERPGGGFDASIEQSDYSSPYSTAPTAFDEAGIWTVYAKAYDNAGNSASIQRTVEVYAPDDTPPSISLSAPGGPLAHQSEVTLSATASDNESGIKEVEFFYQEPGSTSWWSAGVKTSGYSSNPITLSKVGTYRFRATARDNARVPNETTSSVVERSSTDQAPPTITIDHVDAAPLEAGDNIRVRASIVDAAGSPITETRFAVQQPGSGSWTTTNTYSYNRSSTVTVDRSSAPGTYRVRVQADDNKGYTGEEIIDIVVQDTSGPVIDRIEMPSSFSSRQSNGATAYVNDASGDVDRVEFHHRIDGGPWRSSGTDDSPQTYGGFLRFKSYNVSQPDGHQTLEIRATAYDNSGNSSQKVRSVPLRDDTKPPPPSASVTGHGSFHTPGPNDTFQIQVDAQDTPGGIGIDNVQMRYRRKFDTQWVYPSGEAFTYQNGRWRWSLTMASLGLQAGTYEFVFAAVDKNGNASGYCTVGDGIEISVDEVPPSLSNFYINAAGGDKDPVSGPAFNNVNYRIEASIDAKGHTIDNVFLRTRMNDGRLLGVGQMSFTSGNWVITSTIGDGTVDITDFEVEIEYSNNGISLGSVTRTEEKYLQVIGPNFGVTGEDAPMIYTAAGGITNSATLEFTAASFARMRKFVLSLPNGDFVDDVHYEYYDGSTWRTADRLSMRTYVLPKSIRPRRVRATLDISVPVSTSSGTYSIAMRGYDDVGYGGSQNAALVQVSVTNFGNGGNGPGFDPSEPGDGGFL